MAQQAQWETFGDGSGSVIDDETLSLCNLPVRSLDKQETDGKLSEALGDFKLRTFGNGLLLMPGAETKMCVADDIFSRGQLLPFSSSSNSISSSSNCSSTSISRSQSSSSQNSSNRDRPRRYISNKFYAHPSPRPQVRTNVGSGLRNIGLAPPRWTMFRLGVAKVPEIELNDLKLRQLKSSESKCEPKETKSSCRFGCKCTTDVSEPVQMSAARPSIPKRKKKEKEMVIGFDRRGSICSSRSRMLEWLEELSIGKGSGLGWRG